MNDPGQTHLIYDGLTLREVIALHRQACEDAEAIVIEMRTERRKVEA